MRYYLKRMTADDDPQDIWWAIYEHGRVQKPELLLDDYDMEALFKQFTDAKSKGERKKKNGT